MPIPNRRRFREYAVKGVHLGARRIGQTPEQRVARRLAVQVPTVNADGPRVLFLSAKDWSVHVQWEAIMAQALRLRGAHVSFLRCGGGLEICDRANTWEAPPMPCASCTRYVAHSIDAHGFESDTLRDGWERDDVGEWPELDEVSLADLVEVKEDGLDLGRLTRIPVSWFLMRESLYDDPLAPNTWRGFIRSARRIARGVRAALDRHTPNVVVLCNGLFLFEAVAWAVCRERGIDVVTYERGFIKETLVFRRNDAACLTPMDELWKHFGDRPLGAAEAQTLDRYLDDRRHGRRTIDRYWNDVQFVEQRHERPGRLVALFPNLTWDSAVIGQSAAFESIQQWLAATVEFFAARAEHELVIRLHPAEVKLPGKQTREPLGAFLDDRFPQLPPNVRVITPESDVSSYPLMDACDVGLVYTSTTGLELALSGKPVIVAGRTHYRGKGFTLDARSPEHFEKLLGEALDEPSAFTPDIELVRRYAHLFFFRSAFDSPGVEEHVPGLARITIRDLEELAPGRNESLDRICDGILGRRAFVPHPVMTPMPLRTW
jgi:hypothetical protein